MKHYIIRICCACIFLLAAPAYADQTGYTRPSSVSQEAWEAVFPYLLPENHPAKPFLDATFSATRVTYDNTTLTDAGFRYTPVQGIRATAVRHPDLPGYVLKMYLDTSPHTSCDWTSWLRRITGAEKIRTMIKAKGWDKQFKVARKWIYPLPDDPIPPEDGFHFILVVEDMDLLPKEENRDRWYQLNDTRLLRHFFTLIRDLGLRDCARSSNAPWCRDGRIAFVDTESHDKPDIRYYALNSRLNPDMLRYWKKLTRQ